jgi:hypothetical protein
MRFPATLEIGDDKFAVVGIFHIGRGDTPVEFARIDKFHAGSVRCDGEGKNAGSR